MCKMLTQLDPPPLFLYAPRLRLGQWPRCMEIANKPRIILQNIEKKLIVLTVTIVRYEQISIIWFKDVWVWHFRSI